MIFPESQESRRKQVMKDLEETLAKLRGLDERRDVKTPHCKACGREMRIQRFQLGSDAADAITLPYCNNVECKFWNLCVATWDDTPRGHAVHGEEPEPIFKPK